MPEPVSIDDITLQSGAHEACEELCFMEAVAFLAGEGHSDHPACVCPVLGIFARPWNDYLKTKDRQKMKPYTRLVIGTAGDGFGERRSWMIIDWCVRDVLAVYCDARNLKDFARELKGLPEIRDWEAAKRASDVLFALARALDRALDLDLACARAAVSLLDGAIQIGKQADPIDAGIVVGRLAKIRQLEMSE